MPKASAESTECHRWAEQEFGNARLGDRRLNKRLTTIAAAFAGQPTASIPKACANWAQTKATYRFFSNAKLTSGALLEPHYQQTRKRCQQQPVVLVVQDTTTLNFGHPRAGLGFVGSGPEANYGLCLHSCLALTPGGQPLGLVGVETWARDPEEFGKAALRAQRPIAQKESQRWLNGFARCVDWAEGQAQTRWINIADREADIYELFLAAQGHPEVGVLVRMRHNRPTRDGLKMAEQLAQATPAGSVTITVPRKPGAARRQACLEVRFCAVAAQAPKNSKHTGSLTLWLVEAREVNRAHGLHWRLITNLPVETLESALEKVQWYTVRWQIEEYHRVLKSGCQAESRQLESASSLTNVLMVDLLIAWRVLAMNRQARKTPEADAASCFTPDERIVIAQYRRAYLKKESAAMSLQEAVRTVAQMGGFLARKSDGQPGAMTLWRGLERLTALVEGWRLAKTYG